MLYDAESILRAEDRLIGKNRDKAVLGDVLQTVKIGSLDRLLNELKSKAFFLHLIQYADGLLGSPRLVGINADPDVRAYGIPDSGKTLYIQRRIDSDLGL